MWEEAEAELTNDFLREVGGSEPKREGLAGAGLVRRGRFSITGVSGGPGACDQGRPVPGAEFRASASLEPGARGLPGRGKRRGGFSAGAQRGTVGAGEPGAGAAVTKRRLGARGAIGRRREALATGRIAPLFLCVDRFGLSEPGAL